VIELAAQAVRVGVHLKGFRMDEESTEPSPPNVHLIVLKIMSRQSNSGDMACDEARRQMVDYMEGDLDYAPAAQLLKHLENCSQCESLLKGMQNVAGLLGHLAEYEMPAEFRYFLTSGDNDLSTFES
jgi:Putative zinc-finger